MISELPEPATESLGAAIIELDRARLPWPARWVLRDGTRAYSLIADQVARRVEDRVVARVREETTEQVNASWEKALTAQTDAAADLPAFGSVIACPKCLAQAYGRNTRWCEAQIGGTRPEAMRRTCVCGFSWLEAPADVEALSGPQSDENEPGATPEEPGTESPADPANPSADAQAA